MSKLISSRKSLGLFLIVVLAISLSMQTHSTTPLFLLGICGLFVLKSVLTEASFIADLDSVITENLESLKNNYSILVQRDLNGNPMRAKWHAHVNRFISNNAQPALSRANRQRLKKYWRLAVQRVTERTVEALKLSPANVTFTELHPLI